MTQPVGNVVRLLDLMGVLLELRDNRGICVGSVCLMDDVLNNILLYDELNKYNAMDDSSRTDQCKLMYGAVQEYAT